MDRSRTTVWLAGVLLALALLAGCSKGAATETKSEPKQESAETVLAFRVLEGTKVTYHTTARSTFSGRSMGGQALPAALPLTGKTLMEYDTDMHFEKLAGTEATVQYTLSGFKVETEVGGKALPVSTAPGDMRYTVKIDTATGKLVDIDFGPEFSGLLNKDDLKQALEKMFAQWPQGVKPKPGDTWTAETAIPMDLQMMQGEAKVSVTTTYEAVETRNGEQVAKLVSVGNGPINLSGESNGVSFTVKGSLEVKATQYIELKTGLPREVETRSGFKFIQSMKEQKSGLELETEMESTSEMTMVRK